MKTLLFLATLILLVLTPYLALLVVYEVLCIWAAIKILRKIW